MTLSRLGASIAKIATFLADRTIRRADKRAYDAQLLEALATQVDGRLEEALALWENLRVRWPKRPAGYCGVIVCCRELKRFDRATEVLDLARARFPNNTAVIAEAAQLAQRRDDWPRAVEYWELIAGRPETRPEYLLTYAFGLFILGRDDRFAETLRLLETRFPDYPHAVALRAMRAMRQEDWDEALTLWSEFRRLCPDDAAGWDNYGKAYQAKQFALLEQQGGADEIEVVAPEAIVVVEDEAARALLLGFESLGSDCEFGLVQRRFGAEPLGLLRFNSVRLGGLLQALAHRFEGMGASEHTELMAQPNGEYYIRDRRWGLAMHTFLFKWNEDADRLLAKFRRRVAFLKDKLLEDFAEARKTFVFLSATLRFDELLMLHAALRRLGDVSLLHVRPIGASMQDFAEGRPGEVVEIRPGLYVGYLSRPGRKANGDWDIAFDEWLAICRATARLRGDCAATPQDCA
jgi:tetratricopeptide (TPR) repeat protein